MKKLSVNNIISMIKTIEHDTGGSSLYTSRMKHKYDKIIIDHGKDKVVLKAIYDTIDECSLTCVTLLCAIYKDNTELFFSKNNFGKIDAQVKEFKNYYQSNYMKISEQLKEHLDDISAEEFEKEWNEVLLKTDENSYEYIKYLIKKISQENAGRSVNKLQGENGKILLDIIDLEKDIDVLKPIYELIDECSLTCILLLIHKFKHNLEEIFNKENFFHYIDENDHSKGVRYAFKVKGLVHDFKNYYGILNRKLLKFYKTFGNDNCLIYLDSLVEKHNINNKTLNKLRNLLVKINSIFSDIKDIKNKKTRETTAIMYRHHYISFVDKSSWIDFNLSQKDIRFKDCIKCFITNRHKQIADDIKLGKN